MVSFYGPSLQLYVKWEWTGSPTWVSIGSSSYVHYISGNARYKQYNMEKHDAKENVMEFGGWRTPNNRQGHSLPYKTTRRRRRHYRSQSTQPLIYTAYARNTLRLIMPHKLRLFSLQFSDSGSSASYLLNMDEVCTITSGNLSHIRILDNYSLN